LSVTYSDTEDRTTELARALITRWESAARLETLEKRVLLLDRKVRDLQESSSIIVPVESLEPASLQVIRPFQVVVTANNDAYVATWYDAHLSASGDTREEAVYNLKDVIAGAMEVLGAHSEDQLGPAVARQLKVLQQFVQCP